jgi:hypothetical protein
MKLKALTMDISDFDFDVSTKQVETRVKACGICFSSRDAAKKYISEFLQKKVRYKELEKTLSCEELLRLYCMNDINLFKKSDAALKKITAITETVYVFNSGLKVQEFSSKEELIKYIVSCTGRTVYDDDHGAYGTYGVDIDYLEIEYCGEQK